ncbi:MAG: Hpt domain-containing protein [Synergistaceae bacterium]|jgi:HPt (histidine-containing phosphotransfer) domain-containing protein|nr:Hpt domain-containing protein [Synergistaceae bacterium]
MTTIGGRAREDAVPILDAQAGLRNFQNDEPLYRRILGDFQRKHGADHEAIASSLAHGEKIDARRVAHTLKSVAASIGALRLREIAASIEKTLSETLSRGGAVVDFAPALGGLRDEISLVLNEIAASTEAEPQTTPDAIPEERSDAEMETLLDGLERLLESGSVDCFAFESEIRSCLSPAGEPYERFRARLDDLDLPGALRVVPEIREKLRLKN